MRKETINSNQKSTRFLFLFLEVFYFSFFTKKNVFLLLFNSYTNPIKSGLKFCVWFLFSFVFLVSWYILTLMQIQLNIFDSLMSLKTLACFTFESLLQLLLGFFMISALSHKNLRVLKRKKLFSPHWLETVAIYKKRTPGRGHLCRFSRE